MLRALAVLLAALALPASAAAQLQAPVDDPALPLVYVFVVDGLDGDRVDLGQAPFLGRMLAGQEGARATYYRESRSIMVAETNPNHVAMATGAFADRSGIPGNAFAVHDEASKRACGGDPAEPGAVSVDGETGTCMVAESFFVAARRLAGGRITTAGVFGKPKLAQIFATRRLDPGAYDADHLWSPCDPGEPADYCDPNAPARPNDGYAVVDSEVMDHVLETVEGGVGAGGERRRPNLTFVNLPTVDSAGHGTGTGAAYQQAIAQADAQLQRFVANQKELGLWGRTVMLVVSDHSMDTTLQKESLRLAFNAGGVADSEFLAVQNGSVDMVYLRDRDRPDRDAVLKEMRSIAAGTPGVDEALYRVPNPADGGAEHTLDAQHPGWRLAGERTGDLVVTHVEGGAFNEPNPLVGNHGGPQTTDNTFAVISGGGQVRQQSLGGAVGPRFDDTLLNPGQAQNVDVAPTVMALFGLPAPADSEGRVLVEAFEPGALPQAGSLTGGGAQACRVEHAIRSASVRARGRRVRFAFAADVPVLVDVFQQSRGRRVLRGHLVARFAARRRGFVWNGRGNRRRVRDGFLYARLRARLGNGRFEVRRFALRRRRGAFSVRPRFELPARCALIERAALSRSVVDRRHGLNISFRLSDAADARVVVRQRGRTVNSTPPRARTAGVTYRVRLRGTSVRRGGFEVRVVAGAGAERSTVRLYGWRL
ncbi:MAG TPA: alkaline phosphatase family protein [Solirubrobacteraceae bacterium]|jgi:hypothetical protein|nr:alkaline phosphatase family protein [Solirubrobacteraceae bacterium]